MWAFYSGWEGNRKYKNIGLKTKQKWLVFVLNIFQQFPQEQILFCEIVQLGSNTFSTAPSPGEWLGRALQWRQELWDGRAELLVPSGACTLLVTGRCWSQSGCPEPHNEEEVLGRQQGWAGLCCTVRSPPGWPCHVIFDTLLNVLCPSCLSCPGK